MNNKETFLFRLKELDRTVDLLGRGLDKEMKPIVAALSVLGFHTTGSCAGHVGRGLTPYIHFEVSNFSNTEDGLVLFDKLCEGLCALLSDFYGTDKLSEGKNYLLCLKLLKKEGTPGVLRMSTRQAHYLADENKLPNNRDIRMSRSEFRKFAYFLKKRLRRVCV